LFGLARYEEALADLTRANLVYNSETAVLNALGKCYEKLGRRAEARQAFDASLKLNPDQPEIRKIVAGRLK
jgi:Flp pilus assembly protein TadD